uniref:Putative kazal-type inhibitor n=1 Tax=Panstrongylus megistus TaxID=65343 RepID=A0A069DN07_9HEMI
MKLRTSVLSVVVIAVFLTVCMFDFGEAECNITCKDENKPVCAQQGNNYQTFDNLCDLRRWNKCSGKGNRWILVSLEAC